MNWEQLQSLSVLALAVDLMVTNNEPRKGLHAQDAQFTSIAGKVFDSYDAAYAVLERYYADVCCSDDREYYRIVDIDFPLTS